MSIRTMVSPDKDGNYPEGAYSDLYWSHNASNDKVIDIVLHETHAGVVLWTGERNGYDDSDFYAVVWNDEKGATEEITYASTRGWTYPNNASPDATDEINAKYNAYLQAQREAQKASFARQKAATPDKGKTVEVIGGRKLPMGTTGTVHWYGKDRFDRYSGPRLQDFGIYDSAGIKDGYRVGLKVEGQEKLVFVNAKHVKVIGIPEGVE